MKRLLLVLLLLISTPAWAVWTRVGEIGEFDYYVDSARILKIGNTVRMWTLFDYKTKPRTNLGIPYMSVQVHDEFDCEHERIRNLYQYFHSAEMGRGNVVHIDSGPGKWRPVPPESVVEKLWKVACGKE